MKLISEYMEQDCNRTAKVYYRAENDIVVVVKSDTGSHYNVSYKTIDEAEDYAENWVTNNE